MYKKKKNISIHIRIKRLFRIFFRATFDLTGSYLTPLLISFPILERIIFSCLGKRIILVRFYPSDTFLYIYISDLLSFTENLISSLNFSVSNDDGSFIICDLVTSGNMDLLTTIKNRQAIIRRLMDGSMDGVKFNNNGLKVIA